MPLPRWISRNAVLQSTDLARHAIVEDVDLAPYPTVTLGSLLVPEDSVHVPLSEVVRQWRPHRWVGAARSMLPPYRVRVQHRDSPDDEPWEVREQEHVPPFWIEPGARLVDTASGCLARVESVSLQANEARIEGLGPVPFQALTPTFVPYERVQVGESWVRWDVSGDSATVEDVLGPTSAPTAILIRKEWEDARTDTIPFGAFLSSYDRATRVTPRSVHVEVLRPPPWVMAGVLVYNLITHDIRQIQGTSSSLRRPYVVLNDDARVWVDDLVRVYVPLQPGSRPVTRSPYLPRRISGSALDGTLWVIQSSAGSALVRVVDDHGHYLCVAFPGTDHIGRISAEALGASGRQVEHETSVTNLSGAVDGRVGGQARLPDGRICFIESLLSETNVRVVSTTDVSDIDDRAFFLARFQGPYPSEAVLASLQMHTPTPSSDAQEPVGIGSYWAWRGSVAMAVALLRIVEFDAHHVDVAILPSLNVERVPLHEFLLGATELVYRSRTTAYSPNLLAGHLLAMGDGTTVAVEALENGELVLLSDADLSQNDGRDYVAATAVLQEAPRTIGYPPAARDVPALRGRAMHAIILDDAQWGATDILNLSAEAEQTARQVRAALGVPDLSRRAADRSAALTVPTTRRRIPVGEPAASIVFHTEEDLSIGEVFEAEDGIIGGISRLYCVTGINPSDKVVQARLVEPIHTDTVFCSGQLVLVDGRLLSIRRIGENARVAWIGPIDDFTRESPISFDTLISKCALVAAPDPAAPVTATHAGGEWVHVSTRRRCYVVSCDEEARTATVRWSVGGDLPDETFAIGTLLQDFRGLTSGVMDRMRTIHNAPGREVWHRLLDDEDPL